MKVQRIVIYTILLAMLVMVYAPATFATETAEAAVPVRLCRFYQHDRALLKEVQVADGAALSLLAGPQVAGMRFVHWYLVDTQFCGNANAKYTFASAVTSDLMLMPLYEQIQKAPPTLASETEELVAAEQSVAAEHPAITEESVAADEPAVADEPVVTEESAEIEEPAATEKPLITEEPAVTEESVVTEEPAEIEEPAATEKPLVTEEPVVMEEPAEIEEPAAETEDVAPEVPAAPEQTEEPETPAEEAPAAEEPVAEEPAAEEPVVEAPAAEEPEAEEPTEKQTEVGTPAEETPAVEEPALEEPAAEEPAATEKPLVTEEPVVTEKTATAEDPIPTDMPEADMGIPVQVQIDQLYPDRRITLHMAWGKKAVPAMGDWITLTARLEGYDGIEYALRWQVDDGTGWRDVPGGDQLNYSFILDEQNIGWFWRVGVDIHDAAGLVQQ